MIEHVAEIAYDFRRLRIFSLFGWKLFRGANGIYWSANGRAKADKELAAPSHFVSNRTGHSFALTCAAQPEEMFSLQREK